MKWNDISAWIVNEFPDLWTQELISGGSRLRCFSLPEGFNSVGKALLFGFLEVKLESEFSDLVLQMEKKAKEFSLTKIVGPIDFSTFFNYRLRINFCDKIPFPGEPKNNQDIVNYFKQNEFKTLKNYYSHEFSTRLNYRFHWGIVLSGLWAKIKSKNKLKVKSMSLENYEHFLQAIYNITLTTFGANFLFQKIPYAAFCWHFKHQILPFIDFNTSLLVIEDEDTLIGYSLCLLDDRKRNVLLFKTIGIDPHHRYKGAAALILMSQVYVRARKHFYLCKACLMIEGNKIDRLFKPMSYETTHYVLFQKEISKPF